MENEIKGMRELILILGIIALMVLGWKGVLSQADKYIEAVQASK